MRSALLALVLALAAHAIPSQAASLRVAPVGFELGGGTATANLTIQNEGRKPISVQVRVFRWIRGNGEGRLEASRDVVASPPLTLLQPGTENIVRIVRVSKRPVDATEAYRLIVDEVPDRSAAAQGRVQLVVRHSIPIVFKE